MDILAIRMPSLCGAISDYPLSRANSLDSALFSTLAQLRGPLHTAHASTFGIERAFPAYSEKIPARGDFL